MTDADARGGRGDRGGDSGVTTTLFAAAAVFVVVAGSGAFAPGLVGVLAALVLVGGLAACSSTSPRRLAVASCAIVLSLPVLGSVILAGDPAVAAGTVAVGATGIALVVRGLSAAALVRTLRDSTIAAVVVGLGLGVAVGFPLRESVVWVRRAFDAATVSPTIGLLSALALAGSTFCLWTIAWRPVEPFTPWSRRPPTISDIVDRLFEVPPGVWTAGLIAVIILFVIDAGAAFESALRALGPVGTAVAWLLESGLIQAVLGGAALVGAVTLAAWLLAPFVRAWLGAYPIRTVALAASGAVAVPILAATAVVVDTTNVLRSVLLPFYASLSVALALAAFVPQYLAIVSGREEGLRRTALAIGAGASFLATVLAALEGLPPAVVFAGVGASVLVWDLGENALTLRRQLGPGVDARSTELVHAFGSVLAGGVGVAVATAAVYALGAVSPPGERWQALAALVIALAAAVLFAMSAHAGWSSLPDGRQFRRWLAIPRRHPRASGLAVGATALSALALAGYEHVAFFVVVFGVPFAFLILVDASGPRDYDRW